MTDSIKLRNLLRLRVTFKMELSERSSQIDKELLREEKVV